MELPERELEAMWSRGLWELSLPEFSPDEETYVLRQNIEKLVAAIRTRDAAIASNFLTDDYLHIDRNNQAWSRDKWLDSLRRKPSGICKVSVQFRGILVRGPIALVQGDARIDERVGALLDHSALGFIQEWRLCGNLWQRQLSRASYQVQPPDTPGD